MHRRLVAIALGALFVAALALPAWAWEEVAGLRFEERGDLRGLLLALDRQAAHLAKSPGTAVRIGNSRVTHRQLLHGVRTLQRLVMEYPDPNALSDQVNAHFRVYRTSHPERAGKAHFTAYYDSVLDASPVRAGAFQYPLYARPGDLTEKNGRSWRKVGEALVPYYTRREIEEGGALAGRGLEIAWVADYVELHYLHIQGSGRLHFPDGSVKTAHFSGTNGYPFQSAAKHMIDAGLASGGYLAIKAWMREHLDVAMPFFWRNSRFIFFRLSDDEPTGSAGIPLTPGRTIATDKSIYPAGAIGFVRYSAPVMDDAGKVTSTVMTSRFVTDNDTGAAIVGPGRADLYVGTGARAEALAGATNTFGEMYFLIPR